MLEIDHQSRRCNFNELVCSPNFAQEHSGKNRNYGTSKSTGKSNFLIEVGSHNITNATPKVVYNNIGFKEVANAIGK